MGSNWDHTSLAKYKTRVRSAHSNILIFKNRNKYKKATIFFVVRLDLVHPSNCHTERNKTKRDGREVAIIAVLADGGMAVEPFPTTTKGLVFYTYSM